MSIAESSKHLVQISELLEERNLSFSFCLNKGDMLSISALTLLFQVVDLKSDSKLARDNQRLVNSVVQTVERLRSPGCVDLRRIASKLVAMEGSLQQPSPATSSSSPSHSSGSKSPELEQPRRRSGSEKKKKQQQQHHSQQAKAQEKSRGITMPALASPQSELEMTPSRGSFDSVQSETLPRQEDYLCMSQMASGSHATSLLATRPNLDYLSLHTTPDGSRSQSPGSKQQQPQQPLDRQAQAHLANMMANTQFSSKVAGVSNTEWEALLGSMDSGMDNMYNAIYGGATLVTEPTLTNKTSEWSPDSWDLSSFSLGDFPAEAPPQSVLSVSDESLSSGEEVSPPAMGRQMGSYKQMQVTGGEPFNLDAFDGYII